MLAYDLETHLIQPGLLAPPIVCGSFAFKLPTAKRAEGVVKDRTETVRRFAAALRGGETFAGANIAFDNGCIAAADPSLLPEIFRAYDEGRFLDCQIRQQLDAIAGGHLGKDPRTAALPQAMAHLRNPETGKQGQYTLAICADLQLGEKVDKADTYRMKYATIEHLPIEEYPEDAREYSRRDATVTYDVTASQFAHRNLQCEGLEIRAAWALHLAAIWGMRTDPERVGPVVAEIDKRHTESRRRYLAEGLVKIRKCGRKKGELEAADDIPADLLKELADDASASFHEADALGAPDTEWLHVHWRMLEQALEWVKAGIPVRYCEDGAELKRRVTVAYFGAPPKTPPSKTHPEGQISTARDTLAESGDELLEDYAEDGPNEKLYSTYKKILLQGTELPINPRVNILVESGRVSYYNPNLQNIPREGGIRECFMARVGHLLCSVDFSTVELVTLAEALMQIVGWSKLADALNAGMDVHTLFAARIAGVEYAEMLRRVKSGDKEAKGLRQATKALNFGLPGGMGEAKLVLAKRKEGLRFCKALGAETCGIEKVTTYKGKQIAPTCKKCLEIAARLRAEWFKMWPEMRDYFNFIGQEVDADGVVVSLGNKMVRGGLDFCNASNHRFQNLAAQAMKAAIYRISKECYTDPSSPLWNCRPVVSIHDEIIVEMPEERAHAAAYRQTEIMVEELKKLVPHVQGGAKAEPALMRHWYKGAEARFDDAGKLIAWEPEKKKAA